MFCLRLRPPPGSSPKSSLSPYTSLLLAWRDHLRVGRRCDADEDDRATHRQTLRLSLAAARQCTAECRVPVRLRAVYRSHAAARDAELVAGLWLLPLAAVHLHQYARLCRYAANPHEPGDELCQHHAAAVAEPRCRHRLAAVEHVPHAARWRRTRSARLPDIAGGGCRADGGVRAAVPASRG